MQKITLSEPSRPSSASHMLRLVAYLILSITLSGGASAETTHASMVEGNAVEPPSGFVDFCNRNPAECASSAMQAQKVSLTSRAIAELTVVQLQVNQRLTYTTDRENHGKDEYWTFTHVRGDCEDYALNKRRELIIKGWPRSALLLTAARMENGIKHLVLVVVTDRGDFVLDNRSDALRHWKSFKYSWLSRQNRFNEYDWVALAPSGDAVTGKSKSVSAP